MSMADEDIRADEGGPELPAVVLPASSSTFTQGLGVGVPVGVGAFTAGSVAPQPVTEAGSGAGFDNLASRIEQVLSEDGRFASLAQSVTVAADEAGHVVLTGPLPDPLLKRSLLATIHAVPGVTQVTDETQ